MSPALLHMSSLRDKPIDKRDILTLVLVNENHVLFVANSKAFAKALYFDRRRELLCNHSPLLQQLQHHQNQHQSSLSYAAALARLAIRDRASDDDARQRRYLSCNIDSPHAYRFASNVAQLWYTRS